MKDGKLDYHKKPWFLTLAGLAIFGAGYIVGDDNRIEKENAIRANYVWTVSQDEPLKLSARKDQ